MADGLGFFTRLKLAQSPQGVALMQKMKLAEQQANQPNYVTSQDAFGNPILIDKNTGRAQPVTGPGLQRFEGLGGLAGFQQMAPADVTQRQPIGEVQTQTVEAIEPGSAADLSAQIERDQALLLQVPPQERFQAPIKARIAENQKKRAIQTKGLNTDELLTGHSEIVGAIDLIDRTLEEIERSPEDFGFAGAVRGGAQTAAGAIADVARFIPGIGTGVIEPGARAIEAATAGEEGFVSRLGPVEGKLTTGLAYARTGGKRPTATVLEKAEDNTALTGFTSSAQTEERLRQLRNELVKGLKGVERRGKRAGIRFKSISKEKGASSKKVTPAEARALLRERGRI